MQKIILPKWAVLNSLDLGRLIHIGNGEFVAAEAHVPKIIETCRPKGEAAPGDIVAVDAPEHETVFALGSVNVIPVERPDEAEAAES